MLKRQDYGFIALLKLIPQLIGFLPAYTLFTPYKIVKQHTNNWQKDNNQQPNNFVVAIKLALQNIN